ncbi:TPA: hypothetical protein N2D16_002853 [Clostridium botulinum]|nr:hypothetical protein [Clostridium botulinum]HCL4455229.1 hypothetical protein [Clostridium botulinum]
MFNEKEQLKWDIVCTDNLPKKNTNKIDWKNSIGYKVNFQYKDIKGTIEIINCDTKSRCLTIKYLDKEPFKISIGNFQNCRLGKLLGKITNEFKIKIETHFQDDKRDITIVDKEYREKTTKNSKKQYWKYYKYKCNKCGYEGWIVESSLLKGTGCSCCNSKISVLGINTIWDTDRWMCDLGVSEEDAKTHTKSSGAKIVVTCPDCKNKKNIKIDYIYKKHSIGCSCGDGQSYPFKLMFNIFKQLNLKFKTEYSPNWCKFIFKNKLRQGRYDFYFELNNEKCIVEMDGKIGHGYNNTLTKLTAKESKFIDDKKDRLATEHDIEVIRINCYKSDLEYIKNNILNSKLAEVCDFDEIDWLKAEDFALNNLVKKACEIKRDNPDMTTTEIGEIIKLDKQTILKYLKKGSKIWDWIDYNPKEERKKNVKKVGKLNGKEVEIFKDGISLGIFESVAELERQSEKLFGVKLLNSNIIQVCLGKNLNYKNYKFKYIN